jgi:hypothetical protein
VPEPAADALRKRFPKTLRDNEARIEFVAERLNGKPVVELERLGTAFYVFQESDAKTDPNALAQKVHALKPHISVDQAFPAVQTVLGWTREAAPLRSGSQP